MRDVKSNAKRWRPIPRVKHFLFARHASHVARSSTIYEAAFPGFSPHENNRGNSRQLGRNHEGTSIPLVPK
jgi:hypothetical protein